MPDQTGGFERIGPLSDPTGGFERIGAAPNAPPPHTTLPGLAASAARGAAPYAAGAALGAAMGAPFAGIGAVPGAVAGIGATALTQLGGDVYNWLGGHMVTPQEASDKALDALGIRRPSTPIEGAAETGAGLAASMAGVPLAPSIPTPKPLTEPQKLLRDFDRHGVSPSVPTVGQGRVAALAAQGLRSFPLSAPVVRDAMARAMNETVAAAGRAAAGYGTSYADTESAGAAVRNAVRRFAADTSQASQDYKQFFDQMRGAPPTPMAHTSKLVGELMGRFPNAPELTGLFTSSPIAKLRTALEPRIETIPATVSAIRDAAGNPVVTRQAEAVQRGGVLSMPELQELRSQVGAQLGQPGFGPDAIPKAQLRRLYSALTDDMKTAASARGPEAVKALERANINYGVRQRLIERLEPLVSGDRSESVFTKLNTAALNSGSANAGLLRTAKKVMTPEEWGNLGATIISRLGEPTAGSRDLLGDANFSAASFATNWNKLSGSAKDLLFGADTPGSPRSGMEALARVAQAQKNVGKLANTSHTAEIGLSGALAVELFHAAYRALTTGSIGELLGIGAGTGTAYAGAKLLMDPRFARWLYQLPKIRAVSPQAATQMAVNGLVASMSNPQSGNPQ